MLDIRLNEGLDVTALALGAISILFILLSIWVSPWFILPLLVTTPLLVIFGRSPE